MIALDEFEALRLADLEGLYQAGAAERMAVSRPTFGRILESAHHKVAEALVRGKALKIEGGPVFTGAPWHCGACEAEWESPDEKCPRCHRSQAERGPQVDVAIEYETRHCDGRRRRLGWRKPRTDIEDTKKGEYK